MNYAHFGDFLQRYNSYQLFGYGTLGVLGSL